MCIRKWGKSNASYTWENNGALLWRYKICLGVSGRWIHYISEFIKTDLDSYFNSELYTGQTRNKYFFFFRSAFFCDITQCRMAIPYWRRSSWISLPLKIRKKGYPETPVRNSTLCCVISRKNADLIYIAAKVCNHIFSSYIAYISATRQIYVISSAMYHHSDVAKADCHQQFLLGKVCCVQHHKVSGLWGFEKRRNILHWVHVRLNPLVPEFSFKF